MVFLSVTNISVPSRMPLLFARPPISIMRKGQNVQLALSYAKAIAPPT